MKKAIVVLGGGVTGLMVGWELAKVFNNRILVLESEPQVGGLASTHALNGFSLDVGSHRIHSGYHPEALAIIRSLLGEELCERPRRGLIRISKRCLPYPPTLPQLFRAFGGSVSLKFVRDYIAARFVRVPANSGDTFESYAVRSVGRSLFDSFYRPYAVKLWGLPPDRISFEPAIQRVKKFHASALWKKRRGTFFYPARGIDSLAEKLREQVLSCGGRVERLTRVEQLTLREDRRIESVSIKNSEGKTAVIDAEWVISTLPMNLLHDLLRPESEKGRPPPFELTWRSLRLLYLVTRQKVPSLHETFYVPDPAFRIGRISELSKYSPKLNVDGGRSVLTLELPCSEGDAVWAMDDRTLAEQCTRELASLGILKTGTVGDSEFVSRKVRNVYPVYALGWKEKFNRAYARMSRIENLYPVGRSALFLHCNIDHCMVMARRLSAFLLQPDHERNDWEKTREEFFRFQVRD